MAEPAGIVEEADAAAPPGPAAVVRADDGTCQVVVDGPADEAGFRHAARVLIAHGVPPERVSWRVRDSVEGSVFDSAADAGAPREPLAPLAIALTVPRAFAELNASVCLHHDPQRFALLYQLLWRLQHEPALRGDPLDAQWVQAEHMAHAVRRDLHKMKAFVRFRVVAREAPEPPLHVAWFEPQHHVVEKAAPFFAQRFANVHWAILTPLRSVSWDGEALHFGPGALREHAPPADAGEALWLTYYQHTFNPARLKLAMMTKEMPRRYWHNLPEAVLIQPLAAVANERNMSMIDEPPTAPSRRFGKRSALPPAQTEPALLPSTDADAPSAERQESLAATRAAASGCQRCPLYAGATQTIFGEGPVNPRLMFVGEQPGDQEDLRGRPFVGPAGQLFDRALAELSLSRDSVYITNTVKHFKYELRGQRRIHKTPVQQEVAACLDWLERELALVKPQRVVALGATAARALLGRPVAVMRERGQWLARADGVRVFVTLHPSALLRLPPDEHQAAYRQWVAELALAAKPGD